MNSIYEIFLQSYKLDPQSTYIGDFSYEQIAMYIENFCLVLRKNKLDHNVIGLVIKDPNIFAIAFWGCQKLGIKTVLLNYKMSVNQMQNCQNISGISIIVTDIKNIFDEVSIDKIFICGDDIYREYQASLNKGNVEVFRITNEAPVVQCSSGTTGLPKVLERQLQELENDIHNIVESLVYTKNDVIYCTAPVYHGFGLTMALLAGTFAGARLVLRETLIASMFENEYSYYKPTIILGIPDAFRMMLIGCQKLNFETYTRYLISSGTKTEGTLIKDFKQKFGRWINQMYGMLEASTVSFNQYPNAKNYESVGRSTKNVQIEIREYDELTGKGKIFIRSNALSSNYMSGDTILKDGVYFTGDLGHFDENGDLYIDERWKSN